MRTTHNTAQSPHHLRIFLASPGDVTDERGLALRMLGRLQYDPFLRRRVTLEALPEIILAPVCRCKPE